MKVVAICGRGLGHSLIIKFTLRDILRGLKRSDLKATFANPKSFKPKEDVFVVICDAKISELINFERKIIMENLFDKRELEEKLVNFIANNDNHLASASQ